MHYKEQNDQQFFLHVEIKVFLMVHPVVLFFALNISDLLDILQHVGHAVSGHSLSDRDVPLYESKELREETHQRHDEAS